MREYRYVLLDVFTSTPLEGNQLAVFLDAHGLTDKEMQALARETNLSETTFCFPEPGRDEVRVCIFTVEEELPFAGHPTLGTAAALRTHSPALREAQEVRLALRAGVVPVRFTPGNPMHGEMEQLLPWFGMQHDPAAVTHALGLPLAALDSDKPIETVSTGLPFVIVPLRSVDALGTLAVPQERARQYLAGTDGKFFYVLAAAGPHAWRARMQFYGGEDPATGSAAGCATAWLVQHGYAPADTPLRIEQGVEIGRRSLIETRARLQKNAPDAETWAEGSYVRVGGSTVLVAEGRFFLP